MYEPRATDVPVSRMIDTLFYQLKLGNIVLLKWNCPRCGARVTATNPLTLMLHEGREVVGLPPGYKHDEKDDGTPCGEIVDILSYRFNYMLITGSGDLSALFPVT